MNDLQTILDQAKTAYEEELDRQLAQIAAEQREQSERLFQEREEAKAWLRTIMPAALVEYIDLSEYSHQTAGRYSSRDDRQGAWLTICLPSAFPIHFNVYRNGDDFRLVNEPYAQRDEILRFAVPVFAQVKRDDDGQPYISYSNWTRRNHADWQTAVGQALALWGEHGERLTAELNRPIEPGPEPEPEPESKPETTEERIAAALEKIASAMEADVHFRYYS